MFDATSSSRPSSLLGKSVGQGFGGLALLHLLWDDGSAGVAGQCGRRCGAVGVSPSPARRNVWCSCSWRVRPARSTRSTTNPSWKSITARSRILANTSKRFRMDSGPGCDRRGSFNPMASRASTSAKLSLRWAIASTTWPLFIRWWVRQECTAKRPTCRPPVFSCPVFRGWDAG